MRKFTKLTFKVLDLLVIFVLAFASPMSVLAEPSPTGATIASDLADYPPGATVTLTGTGWAVGETVHIVVNDTIGQSWQHVIDVTSADGTIGDIFSLPTYFVSNYDVTATGPISGSATTTFTDLSIGTYDQCSNDLGTGYTSGDQGCRWINGNLQSNNSVYVEGDATVQRLSLTDLVPGSTHTVRFKYGTTKGGKHAYDFLTTWDWSEDWILSTDRCQGINGCDAAATESKLDIPQDPNVPNSFEPSAPGDRQFVMRGGTMTSATTPAIVSGDYTGDSETVITITFTVGPSSGAMCSTKQGTTTCGIAIWFGAHVSAQANWGLGLGAGSISGSPYHVALDALDGASIGQRDNQMQAGVVTAIPNGTIIIIKDAQPNDAQDFSFNLNNNSTISQNFLLDDDSDSTLPNTTSPNYSVPPGIWTASELNIPTGWTLSDLQCSVTGTNGSSTTTDKANAKATITLKSNDTVTCTFTDTKNQGKDLTVTKTATPSLSRLYNWSIDKSVDDTRIEIADGGTATFNYSVKVTPNGKTDSNWLVTGKITVANSNGFAISGVNVTDAINNGGTCSVTNGTNVTVPANGSVELDYSCTYASAPSSEAGTNTATATWDASAYYGTTGSAFGTAEADFSKVIPTETNKTITVVDDKTDPANPVTLGTWNWADGEHTFTYSLTKQGVAGTCTNYTNTAVIDETDQSDSQTVTVCVGKDLTVEKSATGSKDRTYKWLIDKSVDDTRIEIADGGTATFNYSVKVTPNGFTDSGFTLGGTITITNPNDWEDITVDVTDTLDAGGTCTITEAAPYVVPQSGNLTLHYTCTTDGSTTKNTATATWDKAAYFTPSGSASNDAVVSFTIDQETNKVITVVDDKTDPAHPVTLGTSDYASGPFEFKYSLSKPGVAGTCTNYTNTAVIDETDQSDSQTVTVCVGKNLTVSKTATASKDLLYKWLIDKSVDDTRIEIADGGIATFNYSVKVTPNGYTDSDFTLSGTITITNPNDWEDVTLTSVSDTLDKGGTCSITESGPYVVQHSNSLTVHYTCTTDGTTTKNTATANWNKTAYFTPTGSASGDTGVTFTITNEIKKSITVVDDKTDPAHPVTLGTWNWADGEHTFTYSLTKSGVAGTCTDYTNTATISETGQSDSQKVTVCVGKDLTVSKTVVAKYDRTYKWLIDKSVDKTTVTTSGSTATFNYTIKVTPNGFTDGNYRLSGTISIANPNDWEAVTVTVSDLLDKGGTCTITESTPYIVAKSGSLTLHYTCTTDGTTTKNTATANWDKAAYFTKTGSASDTQDVSFVLDKQINKVINVVDDNATPSNTSDDRTFGPFDWLDGEQTATYTRVYDVPTAACKNYTNTAKIKETGQSDSQTVTVCRASVVTNSQLCTVPNDQWRLVFTPDVNQSNGYKLNASNPGQTYYNIFYTGAGNTDITITLPYPYVTQGAVPIHVYSNVGVSTSGGITCLTPSGELANENDQVTLASYSSQTMGSTTQVTVHVPPLPGGFAYINIHLDYGLKGTTGYAARGGSDPIKALDAVQKSALPTINVLVPNQQSYAFSDTAGGSYTVSTTNAFKKNPGIGGKGNKKLTDDPVPANTKVVITDANKKVVATVYTDEDGWYMWPYKYTGKATTFNITMSGITKSVTLKSNGYVEVDFELP